MFSQIVSATCPGHGVCKPLQSGILITASSSFCLFPICFSKAAYQDIVAAWTILPHHFYVHTSIYSEEFLRFTNLIPWKSWSINLKCNILSFIIHVIPSSVGYLRMPLPAKCISCYLPPIVSISSFLNHFIPLLFSVGWRNYCDNHIHVGFYSKVCLLLLQRICCFKPHSTTLICLLEEVLPFSLISQYLCVCVKFRNAYNNIFMCSYLDTESAEV